MRIKPDQNVRPELADPGAVRRAPPQATPADDAKGATRVASDSVKLTVSSRAKELAAAPPADFDQAKVDRLKAALDAGQLRVTDPQALAQKILED